MPKLSKSNWRYWAAFLDLYSGEHVPYTEIRAYADITGLNPVELMVKVHACEDALNVRSNDS